jgi:hypothetical protein
MDNACNTIGLERREESSSDLNETGRLMMMMMTMTMMSTRYG